MAPVRPLAPPRLPTDVLAILERLWSSGHAAYAVGGGLRDDLLGRLPSDWDVATSALRDQTVALFDGAVEQGAFGTVRVPVARGFVDVTTFRREHRYADHRRPDSVIWTDDVLLDLARRDFTVNALAWGRRATEDGPDWLDPHGGVADLDARLVRAVGEPERRFNEDALRLLRAIRIATELGFELETGTRAALEAAADDIRYVSAERIRGELARIVAADDPARGFRLLRDAALLARVLPELAEQPGVPQGKPIGGDLWDHTLATLDAAARLAHADAVVRWAALLHDVGKPASAGDGHFRGHHEVGARMAREMLSRLRFGRSMIDPVSRLVRWHMVMYESRWSDAAVRRFIRKVGADLLPRLWLLREADNLGSGVDREAGGLAELRSRVDEQLEADVPLELSDLVIDGHDLQRELGLSRGPAVGRILGRLLDSVINDPARNRRDILLADARAWIAAERPS